MFRSPGPLGAAMNANPGVRPGTDPAPRVLCVDDNRDLADSYGLLLRVCGFDVATCHEATTALKLAAAFRPAACVFDLSLPGMDGDELARRVRAIPGLRPPYFICATAETSEWARRRVRDAGFHAYLKKPVDPRILLRHLETAAYWPRCGVAPASDLPNSPPQRSVARVPGVP